MGFRDDVQFSYMYGRLGSLFNNTIVLCIFCTRDGCCNSFVYIVHFALCGELGLKMAPVFLSSTMDLYLSLFCISMLAVPWKAWCIAPLCYEFSPSPTFWSCLQSKTIHRMPGSSWEACLYDEGFHSVHTQSISHGCLCTSMYLYRGMYSS